MADELVTTIDGPNGKAEIYEVSTSEASGGQRFSYIVKFGAEKIEIPSLGEAYITAGEKAGVKT